MVAAVDLYQHVPAIVNRRSMTSRNGTNIPHFDWLAEKKTSNISQLDNHPVTVWLNILEHMFETTSQQLLRMQRILMIKDIIFNGWYM